MRKNKKQKRIMFLIILIIGLTMGFALLSTTLKINGIAGINKNTWNIHWDDESVVVTPNSVAGTTPTVTGTNNNTVEFSTTLELPGDFYEFTVDAVNVGSIDGRISLIVNKTYKVVNNVEQETTLPSYILYTVKYSDNTTPQEGDVLKSNQSKTYKIRVEYDSNSEVLPDEDTTYKFKFTPEYEQYKDPMPDPRTCPEFQDDSWDTIKRNVSIKEDTYPVGCEREIDLGTYGIQTVRVANNTTPDECLNDNFSQTACGFVVEFKTWINQHRINPSTSVGGWESSEMRTYVSSDIYNALPQDLKDVISSTYAISGHGPSDANNFYTNDKLYLLATHEIWEDADGDTTTGIDRWDTAYNYTRQLDYYHNKGITSTSGTSNVVKYSNNDYYNQWWTRSVESSYSNAFYGANHGGYPVGAYVYRTGDGVSPAFRIGKDWVLTNSQNPLKSQKWEYYYNNKKKLENGWYKLKDFSGNDQYYFFENGFMKLGWYTDTNNNTYYLSEFDGDNNGYVDGNRVHDGTINIDGTDYTFDSNGICTSCS